MLTSIHHNAAQNRNIITFPNEQDYYYTSITQMKSYNDTLTRYMKVFRLTQFTFQIQKIAEMGVCYDMPDVRFPDEP